MPSDFQSMGFGLPGAIGAALARPGAIVVACVGDGALILSMGELLTAVREGVDLVVVVFNDGAYGLIRRQQLLNFGYAAGHRAAKSRLLGAGSSRRVFVLPACRAARRTAEASGSAPPACDWSKCVSDEAASLGLQGTQECRPREARAQRSRRAHCSCSSARCGR